MTLDEIVGWMEANNVYFFHFTDARNLASIAERGLLSMAELRRQQIAVPAPGGNDHSQQADVMFGMDKFVHLCFKKGHPMVYWAQQDQRIVDVRYLKIKPSILTLPGTLMCDKVANKAGTVALPPKDIINDLDWEILYGGLKWGLAENKPRLRIAEKYEVLVPNVVPSAYIRNL